MPTGYVQNVTQGVSKDNAFFFCDERDGNMSRACNRELEILSSKHSSCRNDVKPIKVTVLVSTSIS